MRRSERKLWRSATTLAEIGELTARWLARDIRQHPDYPSPDPETAAITDELIALNRAGFVTSGSQPGRIDGEYRQRAGVDGFTTPEIARRLEAISGGRFTTIVHWGPLPKRTTYHRIVPVSIYGRNVETHFGAHLSRNDIDLMFGVISGEAFDELCAAVQVTVIGLDWGENTLWARLREALDISLPVAS